MNTTEILEQLETAKETILNEFNDRFYMELEEFEAIEIFLNDEASEYITKEEREEFEDEFLDEYEIIDGILILIDEVESYSGDSFEDTHFILEEDFEEYCEDLVNDCYDLRDVPQFVKNNIDWEGVANDLRVDYSSVKYNGDTYWFR